MTEFIDLIYCSDLNAAKYLACAPMSVYICKGDIVRIDGKKGFYVVSSHVTVATDSDAYKFIIDSLGTPYTVTDKYSHKEIRENEKEIRENENE